MRSLRRSFREGKFFEKLFELAEIAKFAPEERIKYERTMLTERDKRDLIAYAKLEGIEEGIKEGKEKMAINTARILKASGVNSDIIVKATGLDMTTIENL